MQFLDHHRLPAGFGASTFWYLQNGPPESLNTAAEMLASQCGCGIAEFNCVVRSFSPLPQAAQAALQCSLEETVRTNGCGYRLFWAPAETDVADESSGTLKFLEALWRLKVEIQERQPAYFARRIAIFELAPNQETGYYYQS